MKYSNSKIVSLVTAYIYKYKGTCKLIEKIDTSTSCELWQVLSTKGKISVTFLLRFFRLRLRFQSMETITFYFFPNVTSKTFRRNITLINGYHR